jgi:hypothetical protein
MRRTWIAAALVALAGCMVPAASEAACCYFSAKNADILQPAQKVFISWDPVKKVETFTVQPKFEGNALDFGMVIPTPAQPKLHEMPRDFFKSLAVYTILKSRAFPNSNLLHILEPPPPLPLLAPMPAMAAPATSAPVFSYMPVAPPRKPEIKILEVGTVGSLDYKIIEAGRADDLFKWLKDHKYHYAGDEATLNYYVQKKWLFTVMKIDTMQMKKNKDGSYAGEVTPTRFQFASEKPIYPLKITQISVKEKTEALFYVQAPFKTDLSGEMSYQLTWVPMLQSASGCTPGGLPGKGGDWLKQIERQIPALTRLNQELGFQFNPGQRPAPNRQGRIPTTMEWARKLSAEDIKVLRGEGPYCEKVPNVDEGFTEADCRQAVAKDPKRAKAMAKVIRARLEKSQRERPFGYLVREAPKEDIRQLQQLAGHMQSGLFITKFRKIFTKGEMDDDLTIVAANLGQNEDTSEYEEILPTSPP